MTPAHFLFFGGIAGFLLSSAGLAVNLITSNRKLKELLRILGR